MSVDNKVQIIVPEKSWELGIHKNDLLNILYLRIGFRQGERNDKSL